MTKDELYEEATRLDIEGRSEMDKRQLRRAVEKEQDRPATSNFVSGGEPRVRQPDPERLEQLDQPGGTISGGGEPADQASQGGTITGPGTTTPAAPPATSAP